MSDTPKTDAEIKRLFEQLDGSEDNAAYILDCLGAHAKELERENADLRELVEQLTVQLAGCSAAALGATKDTAKQGDWGWSPAYQDVLDLRARCQAAENRLAIIDDLATLENDPGFQRLLSALAAAQKEQP